MTRELPPMQRKTFQFILVFLASRGYPPSMRQIASALHRQINRAMQLVKALRRKGFLQKAHKPILGRAIVVHGVRLSMIAGKPAVLFLNTEEGRRAHCEFADAVA